MNPRSPLIAVALVCTMNSSFGQADSTTVAGMVIPAPFPARAIGALVITPMPATHRWFPYRPIDPPIANPARITGVQVVEGGGLLLAFDKSIDPVCTAGNANGGTNRLYIYPNNDEGITDAALKSMLATALAALYGGGQFHVLYNFTTANCWGRFVAVTKP